MSDHWPAGSEHGVCGGHFVAACGKNCRDGPAARGVKSSDETRSLREEPESIEVRDESNAASDP
jgi:hypothetical protein